MCCQGMKLTFDVSTFTFSKVNLKLMWPAAEKGLER